MRANLVQAIENLGKRPLRDEETGRALDLFGLDALEGALDQRRGRPLIRVQVLESIADEPKLDPILKEQHHLHVPPQVMRQEEPRTDRAAQDVQPSRAAGKVVQREPRLDRGLVSEDHEPSHGGRAYHTALVVPTPPEAVTRSRDAG